MVHFCVLLLFYYIQLASQLEAMADLLQAIQVHSDTSSVHFI
jgi:hypothetical protein